MYGRGRKLAKILFCFFICPNASMYQLFVNCTENIKMRPSCIDRAIFPAVKTNTRSQNNYFIIWHFF